MSTSGGGPNGFPGNVNIGHIHVQKSETKLLIWVYVGGNTQDETGWFLLGGRIEGDPNFGIWGKQQIGSQWLNTLTGVLRKFSGLNQAQDQITKILTSTSITGMYRDARNMTGISNGTGIGFPAMTTWVWYKDQTGGTTFALGDAIACNAFVGSSVGEIYFTDLPAGTYDVYVYTKMQAAKSLRLVHNGVTTNHTPNFQNNPVEPTSYTWSKMGSVVVDPTKVFQLSCPAQGAEQYYAVWVRGLYLTSTQQAPSILPSGVDGDVIF